MYVQDNHEFSATLHGEANELELDIAIHLKGALSGDQLLLPAREKG